MNRFLKIVLVLLIGLTLVGCGKNYEKITYTDYQEYFNKKEGYIVQEKSEGYDVTVRRYFEASNNNVQVYYIEYAKEDDAIQYMKDSFEDKDDYKLKLKDNYSYAKSTKNKYQKVYRVDNVIINVIARDKKYKKEVNNILKDLGY